MKTSLWNYQEKVAFSQEKANKVALSQTNLSRTTLWCLLPGQHIHPHVHAGDHVWTVLEGEGNLLAEGRDPLPIAPGTVLVVPAGHSHGVENTGSKGLVFVSVSAG